MAIVTSFMNDSTAFVLDSINFVVHSQKSMQGKYKLCKSFKKNIPFWDSWEWKGNSAEKFQKFISN